jgi:hypothetical protein
MSKYASKFSSLAGMYPGDQIVIKGSDPWTLVRLSGIIISKVFVDDDDERAFNLRIMNLKTLCINNVYVPQIVNGGL